MAYDTWLRERNEVAEALRTHLAAEQPKPKPKEKAVFWQERFLFPHSGEWSCWYFCRPRMAHQPLEQQRTCGTRYEYRALYAAPPDNEALRRDAERYRWLRDKAPPDIGDMASVRDSHDPSEIDAAIDAAMQKGDKT